jgi:hypothetical protein
MLHDDEPNAKRPRTIVPLIERKSEHQSNRLFTPAHPPLHSYSCDRHGVLGVPHQTAAPRLFATRSGFLISKTASDGPGRVLESIDGLLRVGGQTYRAAQLVYECIAEVILSDIEARALMHLDGDFTNCQFANLFLDSARITEEIPAFIGQIKNAPHLPVIHGCVIGTHPHFTGLAATTMGLLVRRRGLTGGWRIVSDKTNTGPQYTVVLPEPAVVLPEPAVISLLVVSKITINTALSMPTKRVVVSKASHRADKLIYEAVYGIIVLPGAYVCHVNGNLRDTRPSNLVLANSTTY